MRTAESIEERLHIGRLGQKARRWAWWRREAGWQRSERHDQRRERATEEDEALEVQEGEQMASYAIVRRLRMAMAEEWVLPSDFNVSRLVAAQIHTQSGSTCNVEALKAV